MQVPTQGGAAMVPTYSATPAEIFYARVTTLLEAISNQPADAAANIQQFTDREIYADPNAHTPENIQLLFMGSGRRKGLFHLAGDTDAFRRGLKPHSRPALMAIFNLMLNDKNMAFSTFFRKMPIESLRMLRLNKHLMHGDPEQQMAAFRLARLLYTQYPPDQFNDIMNSKNDALDIFRQMYADWNRMHPAGSRSAPAAEGANVGPGAGLAAGTAMAGATTASMVRHLNFECRF